MDGNMLKEINYLTRLIEQHKRKLPEKLQHIEKTSLNQGPILLKSEKSTNSIHRSQPPGRLGSTNVHVNPNFKPQNPVIHVNPKVHIKPLVHVNPKMIRNVDSPQKNSEIKATNVVTVAKHNVVETDVKRSVYVNPKLMKKLSSVTEPKPVECKEPVIQDTTLPVCSRLKFVNSTTSLRIPPKKVNNTSVVILSRRKLIRVRRGSKGLSGSSPVGLHKIKKPLNSPFKKTKYISQKISKTKISGAEEQYTSKDCNSTKLSVVKHKINKYRIDRTVTETLKPKKHMLTNSKKSMNKKLELITIGGIVYKSSKNHLVRRSYGLKKKRTSLKNDKFIVAPNGKKLCRMKPTQEVQTSNGNTSLNGTKLLSNLIQRGNYKNNVSNKVKQRSIQILRNKMRKNNQPCLIFQKFGFCANHQKGMCPKLHDKKQISLCKKFLQGNCLLDNCPLSHDVGPEKMPTCKYFLDGCCTRDACPYRHIKVSSRTPICIEFLQGYCAQGKECKRRHENLCPEFEKTGKCSKGKYCPYPHKLQSSAIKQTDKYLKRKPDKLSSQATTTTQDTISSNHENRLRYYEQSDTLKEDLEKKKESIMKKISIMKRVQVATNSDHAIPIEVGSVNEDASSSETIQDDSDLEIVSETRALKRPPIGSLPAYIPIN